MDHRRTSRLVVILLSACLLALVGSATASASQDAAPQAAAAALLDLNTATVDQLDELPGIGPAIAARIVEYAKSPGFETVDDLINVKGIGEKKFAKIKPLVTVGKKKASKTKPAKR